MRVDGVVYGCIGDGHSSEFKEVIHGVEDIGHCKIEVEASN